MDTHKPKAELEVACHICGGTSFEWGKVSAHGMNFQPDDASFLSKLTTGGISLPARLCSGCNNVQIFRTVEDS